MEKSEPANNLNSTFTKEDNSSEKSLVQSNPESYDITPARHELPPEPLQDPDNYDIHDLRSDEDTDDEDQPRKVIPKWADGKIPFVMANASEIIFCHDLLYFSLFYIY